MAVMGQIRGGNGTSGTKVYIGEFSLTASIATTIDFGFEPSFIFVEISTSSSGNTDYPLGGYTLYDKNISTSYQQLNGSKTAINSSANGIRSVSGTTMWFANTASASRYYKVWATE